MSSVRSKVRWLLALAGALVLVAAQAAGEDYGFMPKGGKTLLLELLGPGPNAQEFRTIALAKRSETQWREFVAARAKSMPERQLATLAAYLSVNLPLPAPAVDDAIKRNDVAAALPPDGRELAWNQCQFCHSLFTSHLTQEREAQGWRNMFESPFHRELKMSPQQREEFARYSALNMPMKIDDVPRELRF
ncbi:MAG: hypothetical protein ACM3PU_17430 [Gemmatimonadota bacterium]